MQSHFTIIGEIRHTETFAVGTAIRELARLENTYEKGRWRKRKGIARIQLVDGTTCAAEVHWYEATGIGRREYKVDRQLNVYGRFALCVDNGDYAASLMRWKIYPVITDPEAARRGQLRIVDESGEDYLYPREFFRIIDLPSEIEQLYRASSSPP